MDKYMIKSIEYIQSSIMSIPSFIVELSNCYKPSLLYNATMYNQIFMVGSTFHLQKQVDQIKVLDIYFNCLEDAWILWITSFPLILLLMITIMGSGFHALIIMLQSIRMLRDKSIIIVDIKEFLFLLGIFLDSFVLKI